MDYMKLETPLDGSQMVEERVECLLKGQREHHLPLSSNMNYVRLVFFHNRSSGVELLSMFRICHTGEISIRIT